jgi:pilus assembly protein Flp/PilA
MFNKIVAILDDRSGAVVIEYALIVSLVGLAIVGSVSFLGTNLGTTFTDIADAVQHATR